MKVGISKNLKVRWSSKSDNVVVVTQRSNASKVTAPSVRITCFSDAEIKSMQKK